MLTPSYAYRPNIAVVKVEHETGGTLR